MNEYTRNNRYFATAKAFRESINHFLDITLPTIGADLNMSNLTWKSVVLPTHSKT